MGITHHPISISRGGDHPLEKLSVVERKARNHRLCKRGGFMESLVPELIAMPDEEAKAFLRLALTSEPAQEFLKKRAENGNAE